MNYKKTTTTTWLQRLGGALAGAGIGLLLLGGCIWLLVWNEGRAIATYRALAEGVALVIPVDGAMIDPTHDGKLVHVSGEVTVEDIPADADFGIPAAGAIALSRDVKMYQWIERRDSRTEKKLGGSEETVTTYSYEKEWRSGVVDSDEFEESGNHANPRTMPHGETFSVAQGRVGAFLVDGQILADIGDQTVLPLSDENVDSIADYLNDGRPVTRNAESIYVGESETTPAIGDLRITYQRTDVEMASIVGKQSGDRLIPFMTTYHEDVFLSANGDVAAADMFESARRGNLLITWLIRVGGVAGLFAGFYLLFRIFGIVGDVIPILGTIIGFGAGLVAFALTLVVGPLTIAVGWFAYRPLLAAGILAAGIVLAVLILRHRRARPVASIA